MVKNRKSLEEAKNTAKEAHAANKKQPKSAAERQAARRERLRNDPAKYGEYLTKQRELMRKKRGKMSQAEKTFTKAKNSARRKQSRAKQKNNESTPNPGAASPAAYSASSALSRAVKKAGKHLPKSPAKRKAVVKELACKVKLTFKRSKIVNAKRIADDVKNKIIDYYNRDDMSRWTPGKQEYITLKDEKGEKMKLQKRYLQMTCGELYALFKAENPEIKVGKSIFYGLRPKNVLLSSNTPHNTCNCKVHGNIFLYLEALHNSSKRIIPTYTQEFPNSLVCEDANHACYFNNCEACRDGALFKSKYPLQDLMDENEDSDDNDDLGDGTITWYQWEETTNLQGYNHLAKVVQEGDFAMLYGDFI